MSRGCRCRGRWRSGRCYDLLVGEALAYHEALARRLRDRQEAVLRCVSDPRVPCTHNPAEDLRRKISGGFRSAQGARAGAPLRSGLATARQQGLPRSETLLPGPDALLARLPV